MPTLKNSQSSLSINPPESAHKRLVLLITSLSNIFSTFMFSALNVALPTMNREFSANAILLSWIVLSYVLSVAVFSLPFGRLADIVGIKKIFVTGTIIFTISSGVTFFAVSAIMLIALRVVQAVGSAMIASTSVAMLTAAYPAKERGRALGINVGSVYAGLSIGPFLGGIMTEHFGWRTIFLVNIPAGLFILGLTIWKIKGEWAESRGESLDYPGFAVYAIALVALMYGFSRLPGISGVAVTIIGILGLAGFLILENRTKSPLLNVGLFRNNKPFIFSCLAALINYSATNAPSFLLSLYLQYIKKFNAETAGIILVSQPVIMMVVAPFAGRLSDRTEPRFIASFGMALTCIGLLFFGFLGNDTPIYQVIIALIVIGLGFGMFASPNTNAIMSAVAPRFYGVASAVTSTMRTIGQTLSLGIATIIMAILIGPVVITPDYYPAFITTTRIACLISATLCFLGIFASMARGKQGTAGEGVKSQ